MIKISYYKTVNDKTLKAFCLLAEKSYHHNMNIFVYVNNKEDLSLFDKSLWTYSKKQFIPHATIYDPYPEKQPVLLGDEYNNLNESTGIIFINISKERILSILNLVKNFQRIFFLYDDSEIITDYVIQDILIKSVIKQFEFKSYTQDTGSNWNLNKLI